MDPITIGAAVVAGAAGFLAGGYIASFYYTGQFGWAGMWIYAIPQTLCEMARKLIRMGR